MNQIILRLLICTILLGTQAVWGTGVYLDRQNFYPDNGCSKQRSIPAQQEPVTLWLERQIGKDNAKNWNNVKQCIYDDLHRSFLVGLIDSEVTGNVLLPELKEMILGTFQVVSLGYELVLFQAYQQRITVPPFLYGRLLTSLHLCGNIKLTDQWMTQCVNLTRLSLRNNEMVIDDDIQGLTKLIHLDLSENEMITDVGIQCLTNLTSLNLAECAWIADPGIRADNDRQLGSARK
jgi:hypothetical protein